MPQRRPAAQDQPGGEDQRRVVVLMKVESENKRTQQSKREHNVQVGAPAPRDHERRDPLKSFKGIGHRTGADDIGKRVVGLPGIGLPVLERLQPVVET